MAFWCTRTLRERVAAEQLIVPYDPERVKHSAYEMGVGPEAFVTSGSEKKSVNTCVSPGEKILIPVLLQPANTHATRTAPYRARRVGESERNDGARMEATLRGTAKAVKPTRVRLLSWFVGSSPSDW